MGSPDQPLPLRAEVNVGPLYMYTQSPLSPDSDVPAAGVRLHERSRSGNPEDVGTRRQ